MSSPRLDQVKPHDQDTVDAKKLFGHLSPDGSLWDSAACAGSEFPDWWYPETGNSVSNDDIETIALALQVCDHCPIRMQCLEVGMNGEDLRWGIWGGLLSGERLALKVKATGKRLTQVDQLSIIGARKMRARVNKLKGDK